MAVVLRPYQEKIKSEVYSAWASGFQNVLLVMPTGMGKTKTFCSIAKEKALGEKLPTAIMVHRKELVQQISLTLAEEGIVHNIIAQKPTILGITSAQRQLLNRQFYDYSAPISVVSVDTLNARITKHEKWAKKIRLWITDEAAHVLKSNKWGRAVSYFENAWGLGVTATPQRLDKRGLGRHADGVFDCMVEGPTTAWGIANGFLSPYQIAVPSSDYQAYLRKASNNSDFSHEAMAEAAAKSHIVGDAVSNYIKFAFNKQAIYFASDTESATRMEAEFIKEGIKAKLLTAETNDKERFKSLVAFRNKEIKVLINIDLFDEGLDVPGIEVVGMCRPTMSLSKYLQMCGRGLRPMPGKDYCLIIDHVGNVGRRNESRHGLPDQPRRWTLDRIVKRHDKTNLIRICDNAICNRPYERFLTHCPYCATEFRPQGGGGGGGRVPLELVDGDLELLDADTLREMYDGAQLEDPGSLQRRVTAAAGAAAGIKALRDQQERIETQAKLAEAIANWAGRIRTRRGYSDRMIHKLFYLNYNEMTITQALSGTTSEMRDMMEMIESDYV